MSSLPPREAWRAQVLQDFAQAWKQYPRPEKKIAAQDAYVWAMQNHNQDGTLPATILEALTWQFEVNPESRYWTTFDKWLLAQRWTDEPPRQAPVIDPLYEEFTRWQSSSDPGRTITFDQFKAYQQDRRRRA
jgi:hypothetical protein